MAPPFPRTGGARPDLPPKLPESLVSWEGAAGLRYFRSKSNQMRIYNPSWGLGSINLNSLGLGGAGAAEEGTGLRLLHAELPSPFQNKSLQEPRSFHVHILTTYTGIPKLNYQNTLKTALLSLEPTSGKGRRIGDQSKDWSIK